MLMNDKLPDKLSYYKKLLKEPKKHKLEIAKLSKELIDMMESELICEGLLYANS